MLEKGEVCGRNMIEYQKRGKVSYCEKTLLADKFFTQCHRLQTFGAKIFQKGLVEMGKFNGQDFPRLITLTD